MWCVYEHIILHADMYTIAHYVDTKRRALSVTKSLPSYEQPSLIRAQKKSIERKMECEREREKKWVYVRRGRGERGGG